MIFVSLDSVYSSLSDVMETHDDTLIAFRCALSCVNLNVFTFNSIWT